MNYDVIYLINMGHGEVVWCEDPDPSDDIDPEDVDKFHSDAKYKALEARIDELLEQQRKACVEAYIDAVVNQDNRKTSTYFEEAIRNARIDR